MEGEHGGNGVPVQAMPVLPAPDGVRAGRVQSEIIARMRRTGTGQFIPLKNHRDCAQCGAKFKPRDAEHRYCGLPCMRAARRKYKIKPCEACGKMFRPNNGDRKYCSPACHYAEAKRLQKHNAPAMNSWQAYRLLENCPETPDLLAVWFKSLSEVQLRHVWIAAIVDMFGDGKRSSMARALDVVRKRLAPLRAESGVPASRRLEEVVGRVAG